MKESIVCEMVNADLDAYTQLKKLHQKLIENHQRYESIVKYLFGDVAYKNSAEDIYNHIGNTPEENTIVNWHPATNMDVPVFFVIRDERITDTVFDEIIKVKKPKNCDTLKRGSETSFGRFVQKLQETKETGMPWCIAILMIDSSHFKNDAVVNVLHEIFKVDPDLSQTVFATVPHEGVESNHDKFCRALARSTNVDEDILHIITFNHKDRMLTERVEILLERSLSQSKLSHVNDMSFNFDIQLQKILQEWKHSIESISRTIDEPLPHEIHTEMKRCGGIESFGLLLGKFHVYLKPCTTEKNREYLENKIRLLSSRLLHDTDIVIGVYKGIDFLTCLKQGSKLAVGDTSVTSTNSSGRRIETDTHCGTLGAIATTVSNFDIGITAGHLAPVKTKIFDENLQCIGTSKWQWKMEKEAPSGAYVDIAAIELFNETPVIKYILGPDGKPTPGKMFAGCWNALEQKEVYKIGATTGITRGKYEGVLNVVNGRKLYLVCSVNEDDAFAKLGDSGSLIGIVNEGASGISPLLFLIGKYITEGEQRQSYACCSVADSLTCLEKEIGQPLSMEFVKNP